MDWAIYKNNKFINFILDAPDPLNLPFPSNFKVIPKSSWGDPIIFYWLSSDNNKISYTALQELGQSYFDSLYINEVKITQPKKKFISLNKQNHEAYLKVKEYIDQKKRLDNEKL